jgi:hypothetical protein
MFSKNGMTGDGSSGQEDTGYELTHWEETVIDTIELLVPGIIAGLVAGYTVELGSSNASLPDIALAAAGLTAAIVLPVSGIKAMVRKARTEDTSERVWTFVAVVMIVVVLCGGFATIALL